METRAAILWEPHTEWSVEDITLDPPKKGEVLVKLAASGLCHSDEHMVTGDFALPADIAELMGISQFPIIGGHEGAGVVQ
jgi:S-(hydroxymethyl)glutathione dehydrogenase/alcohol dehydrogenase